MNHLSIRLARHLSCLRLVEHPSASLRIVLCAAIHPNLRGSMTVSVLVPCLPIVARSLEYLNCSGAHLIRVTA